MLQWNNGIQYPTVIKEQLRPLLYEVKKIDSMAPAYTW